MLMPHELLSAFRYFIMEIFYHRICQQLVAHLANPLLRVGPGAGLDLYFDRLADPDALGFGESQRGEGVLHRLALGIEE